MVRRSAVSFTCAPSPAHVLALQRLVDHGDTIAVNLGNGHGASVRQVIDTVEASPAAKFPCATRRGEQGIL
jgi:UDP-arabinose 4-epimerase